MNKELSCLTISLPKGTKRSWETFKKMFEDGMVKKGSPYKIDLRKRFKQIPLEIETNCCGDSLEVRNKKDFPLEDVKCKCGKVYLIKWEDYEQV